MKREALNSAESSINDDILFPMVDELLKMRKDGADKVNAMFGTEINVELNSSWKDNKIEEQEVINEESQGNPDESEKNLSESEESTGEQNKNPDEETE